MNEQTKPARRPVVALSGASGYIGQNLLKQLEGQAQIIALSRSGGGHGEPEAGVEWRSCDLFSLIDAERALEGADYAVYLVHSMLPSARLTQARFEDMDAILADHFARSAKRNGVKQIVYLSGIVPPNVPDAGLSRHLRSRLEVERILGAYGVPVTTVRAGLIVGPEGSSFPILLRLVQRLPAMVLPKWTRTLTHPIALGDVLRALKRCLGNEAVYGRAIDVGGPEVMSYADMMRQTAEVLEKKRYFFHVPFLTVELSRLWVQLVTGKPKEMVYPLIESLIHPMVAAAERKVEGISDGTLTFNSHSAPLACGSEWNFWGSSSR